MTKEIIMCIVTPLITLLLGSLYSYIKEKIHKPKWLRYMEDQELHNLKTELELFYSERKANQDISEDEWKWVCKSYKRYTELGGNSYITTAFESMERWGKK